jgi:hypothetical protein
LNNSDIGHWFILTLIKNNINPVHFKDIVNELANARMAEKILDPRGANSSTLDLESNGSTEEVENAVYAEIGFLHLPGN